MKKRPPLASILLWLPLALLAACGNGTGNGDAPDAGAASYTIHLPTDIGLDYEGKTSPGILAELRLAEDGGSHPVRLRLRSADLVVRTFEGVTSAVPRDTFGLREETVVEETGEEGPAPEKSDEKEPDFFLDEATGEGVNGIEKARALLEDAMQKGNRDAAVEIDAASRVPIGLALEAQRRFSDTEGVLDVLFQGMADPLGDLEEAEKPDGESIEVSEVSGRKETAPDGLPSLLVDFRETPLRVECPPPAGGAGAVSIGDAMRAFAREYRHEGNPRLANGWLVLRIAPDAPVAVLLWALQEAVQAGVGLWRIRVLLPEDHAFRKE